KMCGFEVFQDCESAKRGAIRGVKRSNFNLTSISLYVMEKKLARGFTAFQKGCVFFSHTAAVPRPAPPEPGRPIRIPVSSGEASLKPDSEIRSDGRNFWFPPA